MTPSPRPPKRVAPVQLGTVQFVARVEFSPKVEFFTVAEVAARLQVSKMTVYRVVHAGELPAARVGRSFRVPRRAVDDLLRSAYVDAG